jgi:hypothetical protein
MTMLVTAPPRASVTEHRVPPHRVGGEAVLPGGRDQDGQVGAGDDVVQRVVGVAGSDEHPGAEQGERGLVLVDQGAVDGADLPQPALVCGEVAGPAEGRDLARVGQVRALGVAVVAAQRLTVLNDEGPVRGGEQAGRAALQLLGAEVGERTGEVLLVPALAVGTVVQAAQGGRRELQRAHPRGTAEVALDGCKRAVGQDPGEVAAGVGLPDDHERTVRGADAQEFLPHAVHGLVERHGVQGFVRGAEQPVLLAGVVHQADDEPVLAVPHRDEAVPVVAPREFGAVLLLPVGERADAERQALRGRDDIGGVASGERRGQQAGDLGRWQGSGGAVGRHEVEGAAVAVEGGQQRLRAGVQRRDDVIAVRHEVQHGGRARGEVDRGVAPGPSVEGQRDPVVHRFRGGREPPRLRDRAIAEVVGVVVRGRAGVDVVDHAARAGPVEHGTAELREVHRGPGRAAVRAHPGHAVVADAVGRDQVVARRGPRLGQERRGRQVGDKVVGARGAGRPAARRRQRPGECEHGREGGAASQPAGS